MFNSAAFFIFLSFTNFLLAPPEVSSDKFWLEVETGERIFDGFGMNERCLSSKPKVFRSLEGAICSVKSGVVFEGYCEEASPDEQDDRHKRRNRNCLKEVAERCKDIGFSKFILLDFYQSLDLYCFLMRQRFDDKDDFIDNFLRSEETLLASKDSDEIFQFKLLLSRGATQSAFNSAYALGPNALSKLLQISKSEIEKMSFGE